MQINDKAILVKLSISMPGNTRKDKKMTGEVIAQHSMGEKSGRWVKQVYPDEALEPLSKVGNEARAKHYEMTLPWADEGFRILPTAIHFDYTAQMRKFRQEFCSIKDTHFLARYGEWVSWARQAHNGTFNESDYPGADKVASKIGFETEVQPVPSGDDFRVKFSADEMETIRAQVDSRVELAVKEAQTEVWNRLRAPVSAMVERLSDPEAKFKDTLVSNLKDIVALVPALNLSGCPNLEQFRVEIARELSVLQPETLRTSTASRQEAARKADAILKRMEGYR